MFIPVGARPREVENLWLDRHVDVSGGSVPHHELWLQRNADALALAVGELMWKGLWQLTGSRR